MRKHMEERLDRKIRGNCNLLTKVKFHELG